MSFSAQIGSFSKETQEKVQKLRRAIILKLFSAVILDTPVLSGRLRANWIISEAQPIKSTSQDTDKQGIATINRTQQALAHSFGDVPVFLSNSLPYAYRIEFEGWSHTKAPEGMVRKNVARFHGLIREANAS